MKKYIFGILSVLLITACSQQQARMPVSQTSGTFMRESIERNKKLVGREEAAIDSVIKSNPKVKYIASSKGYWYFYENQNQNDTLKPKKGDIAYFDYSISDLNGNVIYSEVELRPQTYAVDKQNILMGLRDGIKLMKKKEVVTFLFPSHMAYGFRGDTKRIGPNTTIACTVTLHDFKPETQVNTNSNTPKQ
jgi:gliding motility-associated peptidyl-prolyl isomerase